MKINLSYEQVLALGKAVSLVLEQLEVSDCDKKRLSGAQQALYQGVGYNKILENSQVERNTLANFLIYSTRPKSFYSHCGTEYRGTFGYEQRGGAISVDLQIYRFDDDEEVEVTSGVTRVSVESSEPYLPFTWRPDARSLEFYYFDVLLGTSITAKISTPTKIKEATYLVTEQGVEEQSDTIWLEMWKGK